MRQVGRTQHPRGPGADVAGASDATVRWQGEFDAIARGARRGA